MKEFLRTVKRETVKDLKVRAKVGIIAVGDFMPVSVIQGLETWRSSLVNPSSTPITYYFNPEPSMHQADNPMLYDLLQHGGDMFEGAFYTFGIYQFLTFIAARTIPERVRMGAAFAITNGIIAATELGFINGQQPDYADIPAGVAASLIYIGIHKIVKTIVDNAALKNKDSASYGF